VKVDYYIRMRLINGKTYLFKKKKVKETLFKRKSKGTLVNIYPEEPHH